MPPSIPPLNFQTAATATAAGPFGTGPITFGAPGGITTGGSSITRDVFVGVLTALAIFVVFKLVRK